MKTYYVTVEAQGDTEIVVVVKAKNEKEAELKAAKAYLGNKDISCVDKEYAQACQEEGVIVIDEDGCETDIEEEDEE